MYVNMMSDFISLLPNSTEIEFLTPDEPECDFIFKLASSCLQTNMDKWINKSSENIVENDDLIVASYLIDSLSDKFWEKINTGHFSEVSIRTRQIYALANYYKIIFLLIYKQDLKQLENCNELLDKAILVGYTDNIYPRCNDFLKLLIKFLNDNLERNLDSIELPYVEPLDHRDLECDIPIYNEPSLEFFNENCFKLCKPALLKNIIKHWPALRKWRDLNYILKVAGYRTVPVEIGNNYTKDDWSQDLVKLKDFLLRQFGKNSNEECDDENQSKNIEYLAQHDLFDQIPILEKDIKIPEYCCLGNSRNIATNVDIKVWLGPKGTISPLHQDPKHNILCQVFGHKKIILASNTETDYLYAHEHGFLNNTSKVDAENIDYDKFPLVKNVKFYHLTLQEGESLYIPPKWWHYVKSLTKSFSVSFWWE